MGYISVNKSESGVSIHFQGEMVVFAVLSVLFLIFTGGTWAAIEWKKTRKERLEEHVPTTLPVMPFKDVKELV